MRSRRVAVASDQSLVAEAVRAALASRGLDAYVLAWPASGSRVQAPVPAPRRDSDTGPPQAALMLCDLEPSSRLCEARDLASRLATPWLVLTPVASGPLWGALLKAGVAAVLPSSTSLDAVVLILRDLMEGAEVMADDERRSLVRAWRTAQSEEEQLVVRMRSLTPRERTVLTLLQSGESVRTIAESLEVSEATVRSHVKAVLSKLGVSSQLAAVAAVGRLKDDQRT